ncbi:hypothetical protein [Halobellus sp. GM3]|uniref:hypothetical protein n=1 Tax=Halobellus sp. GM3 TaxID=3458410 RepID=UPI00403E34C3
MSASSFELIQSPGIAVWVVFWVYLLLLVVGAYYVLQVFRREQILFGHLSNVFSVLTDLRVWSHKHRITYSFLITVLLISAFLFLVYWSERLHYFFYDADPLFTSGTEFLFWVIVLVSSGLEHAPPPKSLLAILLAGAFPLFLAGTLLTIVRYTSEAAHESLVEQMARGQVSPNRIIIVNYQEKYDAFIHELLDNSEAFITLFPKERHIQDAEGLKDSFETTSQEGYRLFVKELSYSSEFLFDKFQILDSREVFVFPDMEEETEYHNLQLITTLNNAVKKREQSTGGDVDCPDIVWHSNNEKVSEVSRELSSSTFTENLHTMSYQEDIKRLINVNARETVERLDEYFGFADDSDRPEWVDGYHLDNYRFAARDLTAADAETLDELRRMRSGDSSIRTDGTIASVKRELIRRIETRLHDDLPADAPEQIGPLYGLLVDVAGSQIPIDLATAYSSQQIETATQSLQITKAAGTGTDMRPRRDEAGDIFVVNYNDHLRTFLTDADTALRDSDRRITVFCGDEQITPETAHAVQFVTYETTTALLEGLFDPTREPTDRTLSPGDTLLLFLDHTAAKPQIDVLKKLDAVDKKLSSESLAVDHNDVFLAVESSMNTRSELYSYLSIDKVIESFKIQDQFLHNFVQLRHNEQMNALVHEGKIDRHEAFSWAVETAYYFREFKIEPAAEVYLPRTQAKSVVGENHHEAITELRELESRTPQLFASFELRTDDSADRLTVDLNDLTRGKEITEDEYLLLISAI